MRIFDIFFWLIIVFGGIYEALTQAYGFEHNRNHRDS